MLLYDNGVDLDLTALRRSLIRIKVLYSSVCLQNVIVKFERNSKLLPNNPCFRYGFVQLIRAKNSITHKCANWPQIS